LPNCLSSDSFILCGFISGLDIMEAILC
jgi:hypothetical protein